MINHRTGPRSSALSQVTVMTVDRPEWGYRSTVGFNPFRDHEKSAADIAMVIIAIAATLAVLAWAIFSG
jgi:hypothetical protein